jgi:hypothetical protein
MNRKSDTFLNALNNISAHLVQMGFSYIYQESQTRQTKRNSQRTESIKSLGMNTVVYDNGAGFQIGLTYSDDRQLPLLINVGLSLKNKVFIPVISIGYGKDYNNQSKLFASISFDSFRLAVESACNYFDRVVHKLSQSETVSVQSLLDQAINYRNTFSTTSQVKPLIYLERNNVNGLKAFTTVCNCLFNTVAVNGYVCRTNGKALKHNVLTQLRYKAMIINHLLDSLYTE